MKSTIIFLFLATIASLVCSCATVPVTGRKQIDLVSDEVIVRQSIAQFEFLKARNPIFQDRFYNDMLQRVGYRISQEVLWDMPLAEWEFIIFDSPEVNAFAMPGGKVGIFTGLFKVVKSEDELASVIAHEIAHVTARHVHERESQNMVMGIGGNVVNLATGSLGGLVYGVQATGAQAAWDRAKEVEADHIGIIYMARAGYDPRASIRVMERMVQMDGGAQRGLLASHPGSLERLDELHSQLQEALEIYERSKPIEF